MQASTMVNFRISNARYRSWQREARRRSLSLSEFLRSCIDEACERAAAEEQAKASWRDSLPAEVGELVGMLPERKTKSAKAVASSEKKSAKSVARSEKKSPQSVAKSGNGDSDREEYYEHLEEKYA